eukprot:TRINITY_DN51407_c0_g1_i1.p1 TRINITY_DN51407_c0_g1~~TRINITY_DN51407_c0_g1_i1.p1  ORF type:complete len:339 (-),score=58.08 TRINITY_DN51407_c0_g1_i1:104-1120(-)
MGEVLAPCNSFWDMTTQRESQVCMRVVHAPVNSTSSVKLTGFQTGQELVALNMDAVMGLAPLSWRFERNARDRVGFSGRTTGFQQSLAWPNIYRFRSHRRFWRVPVLSQDTNGWSSKTCVMQMAVNLEARNDEFCSADLKDSLAAASYADGFNAHLHRNLAHEAGVDTTEMVSGPRMQVALPVICEIVSSSVSQVLKVHDCILLYPYQHEEVRKYVFEGNDEFLELPQAFFHHAAWSSGGKEWVCDIQGMEDDDGGMLIIDPVMLRSSALTVGEIVTSLVPDPLSDASVGVPSECGPSAHRFDVCHPKCSQMCKIFDPYRRGGAAKVACGVNVSTCGF